MAMLDDLITQTEKLQDARRAEAEALDELTRMTRADIRKDLGNAGFAVIDNRARELLGTHGNRGEVSRHVLLSALRDAWRAGAIEADGRAS